jgi:uncharacterized protein YdeI (YjbR/CyaY-like superfamily)
MKRYKTVDDYMNNAGIWQAEQKRLREILLSTELTEEVKWGGPCYTCDGQNVVGIGGFNSYFGLWFHQGVLLEDKKKVLINAQEGTTRALRQWRMHSANDIKPSMIKAYVKEAVSLVRQGKKIGPQKKKPLVVPPELQQALAKNAKARKGFDALRPGLQREYTDHIASAKREETKQKRIEKILPMVAAGRGLNDKYR